MLESGQVLNVRYQLQQKLGQSAGRQTWLASDLSNPSEPRVIVKLLAFGDQVQWEDLKLFEREAQVLRQLNHPQIPKYLDSFSLEDHLLWFGLAQTYIPGKSLKECLEEGQHFTEQQVKNIAIDLLKLLIYLHELNPPVLHRDIKPSNLIWGEDDQVYLIDFGAVQDKAAAEGRTFTVVGTYGYAPMEQFGGRAVAASDLYSLGATLIHLVTGICPADLPQQDLRIQFGDRTAWREPDRASLHPRFANWLARLVEPDVKKRFQTAREALSALKTPPPTPSPARPLAARFQPSQGRIRVSDPPLKTRVKLKRSADQLMIQIPGGSRWNLLWLVPVMLILSVVGLSIISQLFVSTTGLNALLFFSFVFLVICVSIYWSLLPTFVKIDRVGYNVYKLPFGSISSIFHGDIYSISDVFHTVKTFRTGKSSYEDRVIVIQTAEIEHCFGEGLSREECDWLVSAIEQWLDSK